MPERPIPESELASVKNPKAGSETDLGELAALFAAHSKGSVAPEVATDLALDIVLNEIVEQACAVTMATGAAIILQRDGEMVCRASSGANAPEMGARLGSDTGLTAECIKTWKVQRCDDAYVDARADVEASKSLGVRSVLVFPLLRRGELNGLLEVFSSQAAAFGKRDELMLEALGQRVLKNLERAQEIVAPNLMEDREHDAALKVVGESDLREESVIGSDMTSPDEDEGLAEDFERKPQAGFNIVTFALTAAIVACAVLLATVIGVRVMARTSARDRESVATRAQIAEPVTDAQTRDTTNDISTSIPLATESIASAGKTSPSPTGIRSSASNDSRLPEGSLAVYENGKEVFRLPANGRAETPASKSGLLRASAVEAIPADTAGSVLHRVEPIYPEEARQQKIQGAVVLEIHIGRDGAVQDAKLVSGQQSLADAAMAAVKQWKFKPRVEQGQAVEMQTRVTLNFRMPG